jgi:hypothetical protein
VKHNRFHLFLATALSFFGCSEEASEPSQQDVITDTTPSGDISTSDLPAGECGPGVVWEPGQVAFQEVTDAWNLTGIEGIRLSVTDYDGDGWADLLVRNGGGPEDFGEDGDRSRWLMRNTGENRFEDVTESTGLLSGRYEGDPAYGRPGDIFVSGDVNNDGHLDIYNPVSQGDLSQPDQETGEVMINSGQGTFFFGPSESDARFEGEYTVPAGATFVDYDRDGNLDLWISQNMLGGETQPLPDRLFRGDGTGHFTDVTAEVGAVSIDWQNVDELNAGLGHTWAWSANACDLNNDGTPELLAASYGRVPNHLWRGIRQADGSVTYVNESVSSGYAYDHRQDWTTNVSAQCHCRDYPDDEDCALAPPADDILCEGLAAAFGADYRWNHDTGREPWQLGGNSAATMCVDINNDGFLDLMTGEIVHWDVGDNSDPAEILLNQGEDEIRFERPGNEVTGLERDAGAIGWDHGDMTGVVFDFDNDGWQDIYIGASDYGANRGLLFHQDAPLQFSLLETTESFSHNRSHGVAVADFDRDGDLDIAVGHSRMRCDGSWAADCYETQQIRLFENVMGSGSNWVQLSLTGGAFTNRAAIGARVTVTTDQFTQTQVVDGGHGHFGTQRDLVLHFGLGTACEAEITVTWPDAVLSEDHFTAVSGIRYQLRQGESASPISR